jgi:hypothetical protein
MELAMLDLYVSVFFDFIYGFGPFDDLVTSITV